MKNVSPYGGIRRDTIVQSLVIAILLTAFAVGVVESIQGVVYDDFSYVHFLDLSYQIRGFDDPDPRVCLVQVDRLPASRSELARALELVKPLHPIAIGIDLFLDSLHCDKGDTLLRSALEGDIPIVLACEIRDDRLIPPDPFFRTPNIHLSHANLRSSGRDGIVRRFSASPGYSRPSFAMEMARQAGEAFTRPFTPGREYLINYAGDYERFKTTSVSEILSSDTSAFWRMLVPGNILVFGYFSTAQDRYHLCEDIHRTPFDQSGGRFGDGRVYGVEIHANILHTILSGRQIRESGLLPGITISLVLCIMNFAGQAAFSGMPFARRRRMFVLVYATEVALAAAVPVVLFFLSDYALDLTVPLIALLIFPRAQGLYYSYFDNATIVFRRFYLRGCPAPMLDRYLAVFKASSLHERLAAAIHATGTALPYADHLASQHEAGGDHARKAEARRLRERVASAHAVYQRSHTLVMLQHQIRSLHAHAAGARGPGAGDHAAGGFAARAEDISVTIVPREETAQLYEAYFLELMDALDALLKACRPFFAGPADTTWFDCPAPGNPPDRILRRHCVIHDVEECFIALPPGGRDLHTIPYAGIAPGCCFSEPVAHEG